MSGRPGPDIRTKFVPPPIDGVNLTSFPDQFKDTEAIELNNYWIYDTGIRQASKPVSVVNYANSGSIGFMFSFIDTNRAKQMMYSNNTKIYYLNTSLSSTDITGAAVITSDAWNPCYFNKYIFLFNGTDAPLTHNLNPASNVAAFAPAGPTAANLIQATGYKSRLYIVEKNTTSFWYGGVGAVAGTWTQYDLGQIFEFPGNLLCCFNWTYNQGLQNDELFVALSDSGEILVYSGDYPAAANWQLIAKGRLPMPSARRPFAKVSGDVYITTSRGMIPISSVISGNDPGNNYYSLSRKIKNQISASVVPAVSDENPFLYVVDNRGSASASNNSVWVLNYERGAWSRLFLGANVTSGNIASLCSFNGWLMIGTDGTNSTPTMYQIDPAAYADANTSYTWITPAFNFGTPLIKELKYIRVAGINYGTSGTFKNTVFCFRDFNYHAAANDTSTASTTVSSGTDIAYQELAPPCVGYRIGFDFSRVGTNGVNEKNEIQGLDVFYTQGGAY